MTIGLQLDAVARADITPGAARETLADLLTSVHTPKVLEDVYLALRAWVWKTLDQRRRDAELREWHDILGATASLIAGQSTALAAKLDALQELIGESVVAGERLNVQDVLRRHHVREALAFLETQGRSATRQAIGEKLRLAQANLTRVLNLMVAAGLIERSTHGQHASFRLTVTGIEALPTRPRHGRWSRPELRLPAEILDELAREAVNRYIGIHGAEHRGDREVIKRRHPTPSPHERSRVPIGPAIVAAPQNPSPQLGSDVYYRAPLQPTPAAPPFHGLRTAILMPPLAHVDV